jgi:hypothetical protein
MRIPELKESAVFFIEWEERRCVRILERMQVMCASFGVTLTVSRETGIIDVA